MLWILQQTLRKKPYSSILGLFLTIKTSCYHAMVKVTFSKQLGYYCTNSAGTKRRRRVSLDQMLEKAIPLLRRGTQQGACHSAGGRGRGRRGREGRGQSTARTCCSVALIRVWVAIHPRHTARKVRSLWVWVGSHPRRTETLSFIYRYVYKHTETKFNEHMVYCFVDKVMKFGECGVQTACVTGQKACVWVVLHPRRTEKVK